MDECLICDAWETLPMPRCVPPEADEAEEAEDDDGAEAGQVALSALVREVAALRSRIELRRHGLCM